MDYVGIEKVIEYTFNDKSILKKALTHSSVYSEKNNLENNQRLEFLGDAVLEIIISNYLYMNLEDKTEGELTKIRALIVCEESLYFVSKKVKLNKFLLLGKSEHKSGGREKKSVIADSFEAMVGAIYLDGGITASTQFVLKAMDKIIHRAVHGKLRYDYKSILQEYFQKQDKAIIIYDNLRSYGPEHRQTFEVDLFINDEYYGVGVGFSKKEAEQNIAMKTCEKLEILNG